MAGRFPKARNLDEFWRNLCDGVEAVSFFSDEELADAGVAVPRGHPNFVKARAVLEDADSFDASFFGMNPKEAELTDPQHRLFLECAWEALENANCDSTKFGGAIGVFAGMSTNTYLTHNLDISPALTIGSNGEFRAMLGNERDYLTSRVSYKLNLRGPSLNIQTACSTSLVAVNVACQHLLTYQCDLALAGAVSVSFPQRRGYLYQEGGITSPDGHCRPFDAASAGTVSGDGVGVVALKRLEDALKDGDAIYAVIKGFATNNDGSLKIGYTAPSVEGQADVIAMAQAMAGIAPETISYIEAHGTGTPLGDPIEIEGLTRAFRLGTDAKNFCALGSVKGNIGHLDTAAGIAGLIKTALALHHRKIPASLHFSSPNPKINFANSPFRVNQALTEWKNGGTPRRAGVSSFGIGGTNAHVVLEEAPGSETLGTSRPVQLLLLSARTKTALQTAAKNLACHLTKHPQANLADVAFTLQTGRRAFEHRAILACRDATEAAKALEAFDAKRVFTGAPQKENPPVVFMFPGQGAQHVHMGRQLYETEPVFRRTVDHCCQLLEPQLGLDLRTVLFPDHNLLPAAAAKLSQTAITQPALFVIEYALAQLWMSWGVQPAAMIGHSLGEYVAACVAGVFSLDDVLTLVTARGRMMQSLPPGIMLALRLPEAEVKLLLSDNIALAAVNAATACVVSGSRDAMETFQSQLAERNVGCVALQTSHAFHSAMMESMLAPFAELVRKIKRQPPRIPFVSNVTGTWITNAQAVDPAYWAAHLRQTVRFADGLTELLKADRVLLEVGPGQTLSGLARQHSGHKATTPVIASLGRARDESPELETVLNALGQLWNSGVSPAWEKFYLGEQRRRVWLPTYPFERKRYWAERARAKLPRPAELSTRAAPNPHNGSQTEGADESVQATADAAAAAEDIRASQAGGQTRSRLRSLVGKLSGLDAATLDGAATFTQLGFESLFLTQAAVAIERDFGVRVAFRQLLEEFPTLDSLAEHIERHISALTPPPVTLNGNGHAHLDIVDAASIALVPLTESQREIWFASQMSEAASCVYNECRLLHLHGPLQSDILRNALQNLVARHEALRTTFAPGGEVQHIHRTIKVEVPTADWSQLEAAEHALRLDAVQFEEARQPFDLVLGPLLRARLIRLAGEHHVFVVTVHHLVCDGYSFGILLHDLGELYSAEGRGHPSSLPSPLQFSNYVKLQAERERSPAHAADEKYWVNQFAEGAPVLELPTDQPRRSIWQFDGAREWRTFPAALGGQLKRLSAERGVTLFTMLLAAYTLLLRRLSRQPEIVVGVPLADRALAGGETMVGHCVNFLPLRGSIEDTEKFTGHLARMQKLFLDADEHGRYAFGSLLQKLNLSRDPSRMPLVSATLNLERVAEEPAFSGVETELAGNAHSAASFDISFDVTDAPDGLQLNCRYNASLFSAPTIQRWLAHYQTLLEGIVANPERRVRDLPLLTEAELGSILTGWNPARTDYPRNRCIHHLFEDEAARTPDGVAVEFEGTRLTYRELNERANRLAHHLQKLGAGPDAVVAVCLERSLEMIVALLGVLKAGGAYLPLDSKHPRERLALMLAEAKAPLVLTQHKLRAGLPEPGHAICIDSQAQEIAREPATNPAGQATAGSLAYVCFTSGSTGKPKGVCVPHRAVVRLVKTTDYASFAADEVFLQLAPLAFDASTFEIWGPLLNGARLEIFPPHAPSLAELGEFIQNRGVTTLWLTAGLFHQMIEEQSHSLRGVRQLLAGGDVLSVPHVKRALVELPDCRLINGYGPTENTTFTCCHPITTADVEGRSIPIGRPIANTQVYLLDASLQPVPIGVPGELYAGGDGLALGYLNQPDLTAERFIPNPFSHDPRARLYRTGDLARWLSDGSIEFLGRQDAQVKIRGQRVELGEIEAALARHPAVRECVVAVRTATSGDKQLVAYYASPDSAPLAVEELRAHLRRALPDYMIPAGFVRLQSLPLTANSKVDRKALSNPGEPKSESREPVAVYDDVEKRLAEIWQDVLGVNRVEAGDDFFELGGHSLLALRLIARVETVFARKIPVSAVFQARTVAQMANLLREESQPPRASSIVEIQSHGHRPPLMLVHGAGGGMLWGYTALAQHLGTDQPVYAFKSRGLDGGEEFATIEEIARHYVADLRAFQPHGPYCLGGYCFGGNVAYEMAREIRAHGEQVALLALINCMPPNSSYERIRFSPAFGVEFLKNVAYWSRYVLRLKHGRRWEFLSWKLRAIRTKLQHKLRLSGAASLDFNIADFVDLASQPEGRRSLWEAHAHALFQHHPKAYAGRITLFRTQGHALLCSFNEAYGWRDLATDGVAVHIVSGAHETVMDEPNVQALAGELKRCLEETQDPKTKAPERAKIVSDRQKQLAEWNNTRVEFPLDQSYPEAFEAQVLRNPEAVAVRFDSAELSYAELNRRANQMAHHLRELGVGPEVLVAICLKRSLDLTVTLLAVLKAGGAYVPLDPDYPKERLQYMLADSQARVLLTQTQFASDFPAGEVKLVCLDDPKLKDYLDGCPGENSPVKPAPHNLAYVIYTSGSTGTPKGVQITHRSLLNHNFAVRELYELGASDRVLQFSPFSFDISVEEVFPTWLAGGAVVLRTDDAITSLAHFLRFVQDERLTVLNLPTAYWHELVEALAGHPLPASLRLVVIGGERASEAAYQRWKEHSGGRVKLINTYGPTETTVIATTYAAHANDNGTLPIGRPIANTQVFILDAALEPVPVGTTGELFIGGAGVARGYLRRPELTAEKFIPNPFEPEGSFERLYRTGDLARCRPDGNIEFVGRADQQIKIRGYRIELPEIETVLLAHPGVKDAVVAAREDAPAQKRLVAYFVSRQQPLAISELREFAKSKLPPHMVPGAFVRLEALPLSPAGKVDRLALPAPDHTRPDLVVAFVAPRTPLEEALAKVWSEVLQLDQIGIRDDFFDLGGHSLSATRVSSRLRDILHVEVSLSTLFNFPTLAALAEHLTESGQASGLAQAAFHGKPLPLSPAQERFWFLDRFEPEQSPFNIPIALRLQGELDERILNQCLTELSRRHEELRATFSVEDGKLVQYICEPKAIEIPVQDLRNAPAGERAQQALTLAQQAAKQPHIHSQAMMRPLLLRLDEREHLLLVVLHQLTADARSVRLFLGKLMALYEAFVAGKESPLPPLPLTYSQLLARDTQLSPEQEAAQLDYWKGQLAGVPALLDLPSDRPRPNHRSDAGARLPINLPLALVEGLEHLSRVERGTLFTTLLAAFQTLLSRYTQSTDVVVGSTVPNRDRPGTENAIGYFENLIVLRGDCSGDPSFRELLGRTRKVTAGAWANRTLPFQKVLEALQPARNPQHHPLFQVMLTLEDEPLPAGTVAGLTFVPFDLDNDTSKFDLSMELVRTPDGVSGCVEFSRALFDADRISRLGEHFGTLLQAVLDEPDQPLSALPLMTPREKQQVLHDWNATGQPYPANVTLAQLFEEQARRTPDALALVAGSDRLSYRELNVRANQLAHHLRSLDVQPGVLVGICLERSWRMLVGILGVLKAGGAYVPMDPTYPKDRLAYMLEDAQAPVLLTQQSVTGLQPREGTHLVCLDADWPRIRANSGENPASTAQGSDLAYVIYTSGSTGQPKGVALEHRNAAALMYWAKDVFTPNELQGVLASTSICFDLSIFEMFVPLSWGGTVILAENALALPGLAAADEVTLINTVPSAIRELLRVNGVPASVRVVNLAGEPLTTPLVDRIYAETGVKKVYDLYGPTETATYSTFALRQSGKPATIGRPLANEQVYLLDARQQPVPIGIPGELFIGGAGVARGYLNKPKLTADKFIPNPFADEATQNSSGSAPRLYRTGDLARWRADGNLEFLGRIDHQVKIRGFRIELGEVETALRKHPEVLEAIVLARADGVGDQRLVAYVVGRTDRKPVLDDVRSFMRKELPQHMVPSAFVFLDVMPLTPNGKVDRKALPDPDADRRDTSTAFVEPHTPVETRLAAIWQEVLNLERVGIHDNFFDLGGHSLLAIQVISRVRTALKVELPIFSLFDAPTIAKLAEGLTSGLWTQDGPPIMPLLPVAREGVLPVSFVQERLWFIDQLDPGSHAYNVPIAVRLKGPLEIAALQRGFDEIARRHESMRTRFAFADGNLAQVISPPAPLPITRIDLQAAPDTERESAALQTANQEAQRPFDLARGPLIRVTLARLSDHDHLLIIVMHHTVSDGWSLSVLFEELEVLYHAGVKGMPAPTLPELPIQCVDFAHWQRGWLQGAVLENELGHWRKTLAGAPTSIQLPADHSEAAAPTRQAGQRSVLFAADFGNALTALCQREGSTPFMVCLTALAITLQKWTQQSDLIIGTVVAGRNQRELENVIGCFMNFLPLRTRINGNETGRELLLGTRTTVLQAQAHQDCPFEKIVEALNPERRTDRNPVYNVALLQQNFPAQVLKTGSLQTSLVPLELHAPLLDLRFEAEQTDFGLSLMCEFKTDLFEPATIEQLLQSVRHVLTTLVQRPDTELAEFQITSELVAQAQLARRRATPDTIAVTATFTAEPLEEPLCFWAKELDLPVEIEFAAYNQAFQQLLDPTSLLARNPRGLNVVLVRLEDWERNKAATNGHAAGNSSDLIERAVRELISALKAAAGRSAVPYLVCLCPSAKALAHEPHRAEFFQRKEQDVAAELAGVANVKVVTPAQLFALYPVPDYYDPRGDELGHVPYTPEFFTALATMIARTLHLQRRSAPKVIVLDCDQTLWAGVCGEDGPDGIELRAPHRALQEFMRAQLDAGRLLCLCSKNSPEDVQAVFERHPEWPLKLEHFAANRINWLPKSGNLKTLAQELNLGIESFVLVDDNPVECAEVQANCPAALTLQLPEDPERFPEFLKHAWIFDHQTVTAEDSNRTDFYRQERERVQAHTEALSMSEFVTQLNLKVVIAELSPDELTRAAQLTQRTNQFNATTRRMTETEMQGLPDQSKTLVVSVSDRFGDYGLVGLAIYRLEKNALAVDTFLLSCRALGRGVEHQILAHLGAVAKAQGAAHVDVHFVSSAKNKPALDFLETVGGPFRQALNGGYVFRFPTEVAAGIAFEPQNVAIDSSALIPSGKSTSQFDARPTFARWRWVALEASAVNQIQALIDAKAGVRSSSHSTSAAPNTDVERELCRIWQESLRVERVGLRDDFFALGGHSLLAVRVFSKIEERLHVKLPIVTIFQSPTVEKLARAIGQQAAQPPAEGLLPIQPAGARPPLFLVHGAGGDVLWGYANLAKHSDPDQPIYGIQAGAEEFSRLEDMAAHYVAKVRTFQPAGPYHLGGYCFGGNVAQEMARQLEAQGESVAVLALLDCAASNGSYERFDWQRPAAYFDFTRNVTYWLEDFRQLKAAQRRSLVVRKLRTLPRKLWSWISGAQVRTEFDLEEFIDITHVSERETGLWNNHLGLLVRHVSKPYGGSITLLRTRSHPLVCSFEDDLGWGKLTTDVTIKRIPGSHEGIFVEPHVRCLARELEASLGLSPQQSRHATTVPTLV